MPPHKPKSKLPPDVIEAYLELSDDCIAIYGLDGKLDYCNPANLKVFGYDPEELCGLPITEMPFFQKHQLKEVKKLFQLIKKKGKLDLAEIEVVRKDGRKIWVEVNTTLLKKDGKPFAIQSVTRDISERKSKELENQLHRQFEQMVSGISSRFINIPDEQIDKAIVNALAAVSGFVGAKRAGIFLISSDLDRMSAAHEWMEDPTYAGQGFEKEIPVDMFNYAPVVLSRMEDYVICRPSDLHEYAVGEKKWYEEQGFHPIYILPVISEDKLVGTLGFIGEHEQDYNWPTQYSNLIRYVANLLFNAIKRKEISGKLRLTQFTLERYSDGVFWITDDFRLFDVNTSACRSLGYSREELLSMSVPDFDPIFNSQKMKNSGRN